MSQDTIQFHLRRAERYYKEGNYEEAIKTLTLIIKSDAPDDIKAGAYNNRGLAKHNLQRYEESIRDYDKAIELQPNFAGAYNNRGLVKHDLQRYEEAIADYDKAIELQPKLVEVYNNRGSAKHDLQRYEEAIADYDKAIELQPKLAAAYNNRGSAKGKLQRYEEAIEDYDKAIELQLDHVEAYNNRGNAKAKLQRHEEAIADYDKAIELQLDHVEAYNNRGSAKGKLQRYEEAIADFDKAIELQPDYANAYYNRGVAKPCHPKFPVCVYANAYYNRGVAKHSLGRYEEAIADYDKAIELQPDYANAYYNRGVAKHDLGRYEEAIEDYDKAIELQPDHAAAYNNRGLTKYNLERDEEGRKDHHKAIELQCKKVKKDFKTIITCYKFIPISKNSIDMLVKNMVYFSDVPSLNDPLECPFLSTIFQDAFEGDHEPRIFSLVVPPPNDKPDEHGIHEVVRNTLLFSHYADAHKGMCIGYEIAPEFLQQGTMFYTPVQYSKNTRPDSLEKLFAIKDELWKYEHEGRFVAFGTKKHYQLQGNSRITRLIFGLKTPEEDKTLLSKLLQGKGIDLYDTDSDEYSSFDLKFRVCKQSHVS